jgi:hypothetical protein
MLKSLSMQGSGQRARTLAGARGAEVAAGTFFLLFFLQNEKIENFAHLEIGEQKRRKYSV